MGWFAPSGDGISTFLSRATARLSEMLATVASPSPSPSMGDSVHQAITEVAKTDDAKTQDAHADASLPPASPLAPLSVPPPTASARQPSSPKKPRWTRGRFVEGLEDCERQEKPREGTRSQEKAKRSMRAQRPKWRHCHRHPGSSKDL